MRIDKFFTLLLTIAASATIGAAIASRSRRQQREAAHQEHSSNLKTWESEGGNVAPDAAE